MKKWKRGYLYGIIPVDVLVESTPTEDLRDAGATVGLVILLCLIAAIALAVMVDGS